MSQTLDRTRTRQARIDRLRARLDLIKMRQVDEFTAPLIAVIKGILDLLEDEL